MKLSKYFTLAEIEASEIAARYEINNSLPTFLYDKAKRVCRKLDAVRTLLGSPVVVTSGYRCMRLNRHLKSKDTSQHMQMEAFDFICPKYGTPLEICMLLMQNWDIIQFDQLIQEHSWVHISFIDEFEAPIPARKPRGEVLTLLPGNRYRKGL